MKQVKSLKLKQLKLLVAVTLLSLLFGCASQAPVDFPKVKSPLGLYKSNTQQKYWIAILQDESYLLCSSKTCQKGVYQKVPVNFGIILIDFYLFEHGLDIERLIHGELISEQYLNAMKKIRESSFRPNDQVFNIGDCDGTPCVGIGHRRDGVKFFKIEDFDEFW